MRLMAVCAAAVFALSGKIALAQNAFPAGSLPAASPTPLPDPCGSILSIVNRPTVTTAVCTVRPKQALLETGYTNVVTTSAGGGNTVVYPQTYVQVGTSDPHLEFDLTPPSFEQSSLGGTIVRGTGDASLGAKYELGYGARWLYGVNAFVTFPTGAAAFTAGSAQYVGNFNWSYTVNPVIGLGGTVGFNKLSSLNSAGYAQAYFALIPSLVVTASLPGPSQLFGEYAYFSAAGIGLGDRSLLDFGYARDLGEHLQLDVEYGFSPPLLDGQRQHYAGAGASFMI